MMKPPINGKYYLFDSDIERYLEEHGPSTLWWIDVGLQSDNLPSQSKEKSEVLSARLQILKKLGRVVLCRGRRMRWDLSPEYRRILSDIARQQRAAS